MLRDQRHMSGVAVLATVEDVRAFWERFVVNLQASGREIQLTRIGKTVEAYVSAGRWVADCPRCGSGIAAWHENPDGACLDCGGVVEIDFPEPREREAAERILLARPNEATRSWLRHQGEPLSALEGENIVREIRTVAGPGRVIPEGLIESPLTIARALGLADATIPAGASFEPPPE